MAGAAQTVSLPLPAHVPVERFSVLDFLRKELAPFPGRAIATFRVVVEAAVVLALCMALQIPDPHLSVWIVTRVAMEDSSQSLLAGVLVLVALTIGIAVALILMTFAMDQPWLRFCLMAALAGLAFFLRQAFVVGFFGFVIGLIATLIMTVPDFIPIPELAVRASLWLWPVFGIGIAAAVAGNLLIAPTNPETLLRDEIETRMRAAEDVLARRRDGRREPSTAARLAEAGITRLLMLLKSAEIAHPSLKTRHSQQSALITLVDRLVSGAALLELLPGTAPHAEERERLQRLAESCAAVRHALADGRTLEPGQPGIEPLPPLRGASTLAPVLSELEHVVDLIRQALGPEGASADAAAPPRVGLFVADAFTNPEYVRYALKGTLAVMICYVLQNAVDWPGIRTCLITCMIVGLANEGATIQKGTLRVTGAVVGAALGFAAIMFLIPGMESITSLTLLVAAGSAVAAWVVLGSPRIAYAGVQLAFAFYVCVIQGWEPTWHFDTIRDRLVGIFLGNAIITLVFHYVWPVRASAAMWTSFGSALRTMARLTTISGNDERAPVATDGLRQQVTRQFATAQQLADQAAFELGDSGGEGRVARERLQQAAADAQSVFLTQLAIAHEWPPPAASALPDTLAAELRRFDADVANSLDVIAERSERTANRVMPNLRAALAAVTAVTDVSLPGVESSEVAAHVEGRLALYRELVPRIERVALDFGA